MSNDENRNLPARRDEPKKSITLATTKDSLDALLQGLPDDVANQLRADYAKGMIDVNKTALQYGVETQALAAALRNMADETVNANKENTHITATRYQEDSLGKTEVIMGNTEAAKRGKLTRSQSGLPDYTLAYIVAAVIVVIVLALLLKR